MELKAVVTQSPRKLVFMDCDGVIFDTNRLKCDAFRHALEGYPRDEVEALVAYHRQTGGVSRYLKFERFFREMHPVVDVDREMGAALGRFASYCETGYARMRPRAEALAFAEIHRGPDQVYVVSGSDERELRRVFEAQEIAHRFVAIHGSPVSKKTHLTRLMAERRVSARDCLFIGDGWGDWDCAQALGVPFVFLEEMSEWDAGAETVRTSEGPMAIAPTWSELLEVSRRHPPSS